MPIIIKNGHVIDPSQGINGLADIVIKEMKIGSVQIKSEDVKIRKMEKTKRISQTYQLQDLRTLDADGLYVFPGLVDMHTHLREPGFENKETIRSGTMAAVRGGFTCLCCMPNTVPVNDNEDVTGFILRKNDAEGACAVFPIGAITRGQKGEELVRMELLRKKGCVAFSDDGRPVINSLVMRKALEYSSIFNTPIISHCEDVSLSDGGVMNEGAVSARLGLKGIPSAAEDVMVARDVILAELTKGRLHIAHVSTEGSVRLIREAKERGVNVTAETCPHYFSLTEEAVKGYNTSAKVNPPLRTQRDVDAIKEGLRDGTIDVIATDHAPHHRDEKLREFDQAPFGISGLDTALGLSLRLVEEGVLTLSQLAEKMVLNPARILGLSKGTLQAGADADVTIVDMKKEFTVVPEMFVSKGKNTPFAGWELKGRPLFTIYKGKIYEW